MPDPVLKNWRLIANSVLVGEVSGHPSLKDGWITTSKVVEISDDWAQTGSRRYCLEDPLPDDQPLPPAARDAVLARLLHNSGKLAVSDLERLSALADELAKAPGKESQCAS